jgi:hypothetical protein
LSGFTEERREGDTHIHVQTKRRGKKSSASFLTISTQNNPRETRGVRGEKPQIPTLVKTY